MRKHKLSFQEASRVFEDPLVFIEHDVSEDYGEDRFVAVGLVDDLLIAGPTRSRPPPHDRRARRRRARRRPP